MNDRQGSTGEGFLLLEDGTLFRGKLLGTESPTVAEVVFTTNMTGYQEVFTDPSYRGQIVVMTAPQIGNSGINLEDQESGEAQIAGVVVREVSRSFSNWRATEGLQSWLARAGIPVLEEVDTRRLTRHLRSAGVMRGVMAGGTEPARDALAALEACPPMEGLDLASRASTRESYEFGRSDASNHVVAYDFGMKRNILRLFERNDCRVTVVPATTSAQDVLALEPDGVFLSNGPGDPAAVDYAQRNILELAESGIPVFGICLGHQLLGLAFGGETVKLPFGHRGGNQPVKSLVDGRVMITAQNHGFAVRGDGQSVPGAPELQVTHVNLNDGTVEGLKHRDLPIFGVQYHPEASPGPRDAAGHFAEFLATVRARSGRSGPSS